MTAGNRPVAATLVGLLTIGLGAPSATAESEWAFAASVYAYLVPDDGDYLQPTFTADRRWLHLEVRYNYEDIETGSAWAGYNFSFGDDVAVNATPMLGVVVGETTGVAPGYCFSLDWRRFEFYSEGEFVFETHEKEDSFFYSWSEATLSPVVWLRAGLVAQRTRVFHSERDIQRGLLVGFSFKAVEIAAHVFNPADDSPTYVLSVSAEF